MTFKRIHIGFDIDLETLLRSASDVRVDVFREELATITPRPRRITGSPQKRLAPPRHVTPEGIRIFMLRYIVNKAAPVTGVEMRDLTMARGYSKSSYSPQLHHLRAHKLIKRLKDGRFIHTDRAIVELANHTEAPANGK